VKTIVWTATLAAVALLTASCRPAGPKPTDNVPVYEPAVEPDVPETVDEPAPPQTPAETLPDPAEGTDKPAEDEADSEKTAAKPRTGGVFGSLGKALVKSAARDAPDESKEGGVLGTVGKALLKSVGGDTEEGPSEAPPFKP